MYAVEHALRSRRKIGFVDGTYTAPEPLCTAKDWRVLQSTLVSWMENTIALEVKALLPRFKNAKDLWDVRKSRFSQTEGPKVKHFKKEVCDVRPWGGMSLAT